MSSNSALGAGNSQALAEAEMLRYFSNSHPSFIVAIPREARDSREMKLLDSFINSLEERLPTNVILQLANGHETHVHFKKLEQMLIHMTEFFNDCRGLFGSLLVYSYKGNGRFFVNILKDDLVEVIYFKNRTIPRGTFYDQDLVTGVGWKILVHMNHPDVQAGEVAIPVRFWRNFGKFLPPTVNFSMRNGSRYYGTCSSVERRMTGLQDLVRDYGLSETEKILLTYSGGGNFFVMIFDISDVEAMVLNSDSDGSGDNVLSDDSDVQIIDDGGQIADLDDEYMTFSKVMTACNVNGTSHGAYIPSYIQRSVGIWEAGDEVILRTGEQEWNVSVVISNRIPRFSRGWNQFAQDNHIVIGETVQFHMLEEEDATVFVVTFVNRQ